MSYLWCTHAEHTFMQITKDAVIRAGSANLGPRKVRDDEYAFAQSSFVNWGSSSKIFYVQIYRKLGYRFELLPFLNKTNKLRVDTGEINLRAVEAGSHNFRSLMNLFGKFIYWKQACVVFARKSLFFLFFLFIEYWNKL